MNPAYWSIILMVLAFAVLGLELLIPSGGMLSVLAALLLIASLVVGFMADYRLGLGLVCAMSILVPLMIGLFIKFWPHTPIGRRMLIGTAKQAEVLPRGGLYETLPTLIGRRGTAKTKMLPSGIVVIEGRPYDAISDGFAIEIGDPVEVLAIRTNKVVVRRVDPDEAATSSASAAGDDILSKSIDELGLGQIGDDR